MKELDPLLRDKVRFLGSALGDTIRNDRGDDMVERIESIRKQAKKARKGGVEERDELLAQLKSITDDTLVPVVRGFNQFLNLANIAEQQHGISWRRDKELQDDVDGMLHDLLDRLEESGIKGEELTAKVVDANIEV